MENKSIITNIDRIKSVLLSAIEGNSAFNIRLESGEKLELDRINILDREIQFETNEKEINYLNSLCRFEIRSRNKVFHTLIFLKDKNVMPVPEYIEIVSDKNKAISIFGYPISRQLNISVEYQYDGFDFKSRYIDTSVKNAFHEGLAAIKQPGFSLSFYLYKKKKTGTVSRMIYEKRRPFIILNTKDLNVEDGSYLTYRDYISFLYKLCPDKKRITNKILTQQKSFAYKGIISEGYFPVIIDGNVIGHIKASSGHNSFTGNIMIALKRISQDIANSIKNMMPFKYQLEERQILYEIGMNHAGWIIMDKAMPELVESGQILRFSLYKESEIKLDISGRIIGVNRIYGSQGILIKARFFDIGKSWNKLSYMNLLSNIKKFRETTDPELW